MCSPAIAQGLGPRAGTLPPAVENQFQTFMSMDPRVRDWRNAYTREYSEPPQIEGGNYDYRQAWQAGVAPERVAVDAVPHWPSVGKSADHPTMWKQTYMDKFGADPDEQAQTGLSPVQSAFINNQLRQDMIQGDVRRVMGGR